MRLFMDIFLTATLILVLMASFPRVLVSAQQDAAGGGGDAADVAAGDGGDGGGAAVTNNSTAADSSNSNSATTEKEPAVPEWGGCVMEGTTADTKVTIGATTIVCLQIGNGTDWSAGLSYIRLAFQPTADQYSRLYIPNSFADLAGNNSRGTIWQNNNITVNSASYGGLSFLRTYYDHEGKKIYPFLTAIIDVDKGVVTGITWDNSCVFCAKGFCEEITYNFNGVIQTPQSAKQSTGGCYIREEDCQKDSTLCDLMVYVVWSGTDSNNRAFQSSQSRFGAFPAQNIYNEISQLFPTIPSITGDRI